ncbi:MAG: DEAD/DEAH box helicase [Candidatus Thermoplasmatota archaeon]|nr:DEAD/DEAH box helicase [Candidatus Thermoplasmatota archaeon]
MEFKELGLNDRLVATVKGLGYTSPTQIQEQAIPIVLQGKDVLGQAQTGTGKTAAFALPILDRLMEGPRGRVRALIIAPTRELSEQIDSAIRELSSGTGLRSTTVYGGVSMEGQVARLRARPDIVVACPGRLLDHMNRGTIDLRGIEVLVLDEADRMLDMGFLQDIRRIMRSLPVKRQTMLFSATIPGDIKRLSFEFMKDPVSVEIGHSAPVESVSHAIYPVPHHLKTSLLMSILKGCGSGSVIIFTRTKHRAKRLAYQLQKDGYPAASLQGNLSQNKRQEALDGFRRGSYRILVATDIAARGIDISTISHVINYDMPDTGDAYTHRIGRTGRVDRTGIAYTLVTFEDESMVRTIEGLIGSNLERRTIDGFDYGGFQLPAGRPSQPRSGPGRRGPAPARSGMFRETRTLYRSLHA